ncbi:putative sulfate exporter family transporter [Rarobacter faecitabidus]
MILTGLGLGCVAAQAAVPAVSAIVFGLAVGIAARPVVLRLPGDPARILADANSVAGTVLRTGVALLGIRFTLRDLGTLGPRGMAIAALTLIATFLVTRIVARRYGNDPDGSATIAAGFAVCGAAAASTMAGALAERGSGSRRRSMMDEYSAATIAMVCVLGLVAIPVTIFMSASLGLSDADTGLWMGASLPEVAHVVMAGDLVSPEALAIATVAKLLRVALLAPLVLIVGAAGSGRLLRGRRTGRAGSKARIVPLFVIGFIACIALGTVFDLPEQAEGAAPVASTAMIAGAMVAIGANISISALARRWRTTGIAALTGTVTALAVPLIAIMATR